jgi:hypothetical protein
LDICIVNWASAEPAAPIARAIHNRAVRFICGSP